MTPDPFEIPPNDLDRCDLCLEMFEVGDKYFQIGMAYCHNECVVDGTIQAAPTEETA